MAATCTATPALDRRAIRASPFVRAAVLLGAACWLAACARAPSGEAQPLSPTAVDPPAAVPAEGAGPAATDAAGVDPAQLLARYLGIAASRVASPACLQEDQAAWQVQMETRCGADLACFDAARLARARLLEGVLPGAALERRLDALPADDAPQLLFVGGNPRPDTGEAPAVAVTLEGVPYEDEGGFLLTGDGFDAQAHEELAALLGDEAAIAARFGDGQALRTGVAGVLPSGVLDDEALAVLQAPAARAMRLRVRGWAQPVPGEPPVVDGERCVVVERSAAAR
jgi:hypothetical protein